MSYTYRFNHLNQNYNIDLFKYFRVLSIEFTAEENIFRLLNLLYLSQKYNDIISRNLEEHKSLRIFFIPIIHQDIELGYKMAHFLIQQDKEEDGKYIFIGNIQYHIDNDLHLVIEEYFLNSNSEYYSTEQLLLMIDNQYITLFCDIFDNDNYYNESNNSYFENSNIDNSYLIEEDYDNQNEEDNILEPYEINNIFETSASNNL